MIHQIEEFATLEGMISNRHALTVLEGLLALSDTVELTVDEKDPSNVHYVAEVSRDVYLDLPKTLGPWLFTPELKDLRVKPLHRQFINERTDVTATYADNTTFRLEIHPRGYEPDVPERFRTAYHRTFQAFRHFLRLGAPKDTTFKAGMVFFSRIPTARIGENDEIYGLRGNRDPDGKKLTDDQILDAYQTLADHYNDRAHTARTGGKLYFRDHNCSSGEVLGTVRRAIRASLG